MRKTQEKEVITIDEVEIAVICDVCQKEILNEEDLKTARRTKHSYFYEVYTSHRDWGNDSGESLAFKDICSDECLLQFLQEYLKDESHTLHFEFERRPI